METFFTIFGLLSESEHYNNNIDAYIDDVFPALTWQFLLITILFSVTYYLLLGRTTRWAASTLGWIGCISLLAIANFILTAANASAATMTRITDFSENQFMLTMAFWVAFCSMVMFFALSFILKKASIHSRYIPF